MNLNQTLTVAYSRAASGASKRHRPVDIQESTIDNEDKLESIDKSVIDVTAHADATLTTRSSNKFAKKIKMNPDKSFVENTSVSV